MPPYGLILIYQLCFNRICKNLKIYNFFRKIFCKIYKLLYVKCISSYMSSFIDSPYADGGYYFALSV